MKRNLKVVLGLLIVVVLLGLGYFVYNYYAKESNRLRQAIFLTNGQVYFGYISHPEKQLIVLRDVYYLKTQDLIDTSANSDEEKKKISLVKLGKELHGPTDEILINRDQVLFIESMRSNSKINDAIKKYVENNN